MDSGAFQNPLMDTPVIIDPAANAIVAGNHRMIAAEMTGFDLSVNLVPGSATGAIPLTSVPLQPGRINPPILNPWPMNILYVENHTVFAQNVSRQFLSGHKVTVVPNLAAARNEILNGDFDLLLVDYDLDDGKGEELIREIRAGANSIDIIAVSSHEEGNAALIKAGATAVCSKMDFDKIQSIIDKVKKND